MRGMGLLGFGVLSILLPTMSGCGGATGNTNLSSVNTNVGVSNSISNSNLNAVSTTGSTVDAWAMARELLQIPFPLLRQKLLVQAQVLINHPMYRICCPCRNGSTAVRK